MLPENMRGFIKSHPILFSLYQPVNTALAPIFDVTFTNIKVMRKKLFSIVDRTLDLQKVMINIGGGHYFRRHWKVLDFPSKHYNYLGGSIDYAFDLTSEGPFPLSDSTVSFFYSSHTFEHIPQEYCQYIFNEMFRCLKPGGAVRIMLPDFDLAYNAFAKNDIDFFVKYPGASIEEKLLNFLASYLQDKVPEEKVREDFRSMTKEEFAEYYTQQIPRESQRENPGSHINWWNYEKLHSMLKQAGFEEIYRSTLQSSRFPEMQGVGRHNGFDSTHPELYFIVEAIK
jgi:predicted SAM-dependent methyltransferase